MNTYEVKDIESGQTLQGSAQAVARMLNVKPNTVRKYARNAQIAKDRYWVQLVKGNLEEEYDTDSQIKTGCGALLKQWDEIHEIAQEIKAGVRVIVRCSDGKRYAVRCVDESRESFRIYKEA